MIDTSGLTDADWAEINKIQQAHKEAGKRALNRAMAALAKDPLRFVAVVGAFFPEMIREALKDAAAEAGITDEDVRGLCGSSKARPVINRPAPPSRSVA